MQPLRQLRIVNGGTEDQSSTPALKVAFASSDRKYVDQHFGTAVAFVIYALNPHHTHCEAVIQFSSQFQDGNEQKLLAKLQALTGCVAVYCQAVGGSAIRQLHAQGIQPVKVPAGTAISALLTALQRDLHTQPGPWLTRAIAHLTPKAANRFETMAKEDWQE